jgi:hypothetical protein
MGPPDSEVPGAIPFHAVLGRNDELAVAIVAAQAFSSGISIKIAIRLRYSDTTPHGLGAEIVGHHHRGGSGQGFLLGVAYPDGRTVSNVNSQRFPDPLTPQDQPALIESGGGGWDRTVDMEYWLTPIPPPGDLTVIVAWPTRGITESRAVIPADAIAEGLAHKIELWPWQAMEEDDEPPLPPRPVLPEGGWFAQHATDHPPRTNSPALPSSTSAAAAVQHRDLPFHVHAAHGETGLRDIAESRMLRGRMLMCRPAVPFGVSCGRWPQHGGSATCEIAASVVISENDATRASVVMCGRSDVFQSVDFTLGRL